MNRRDLIKAAAAMPFAAVPAMPQSGSKSRLRTALCAYSYRNELQSKKLSYMDLVKLAVDWEIDGLDLTVYWFPNTSDEFLLPLKAFAFRNGVEIYSISVRTEMTVDGAPEQAKQVEEVHKWVDVAAKLGAGHIRVFGGKIPNGKTEDQAAEMVVQVLTKAAPYAGSKGVILGLENHGGVTDRAETISKIVRKVNSPWVGVNLDTGNFRKNIFPQIDSLIPLAVNVQVKAEQYTDNGGKEPQDWNTIVKMLAGAKYRGYLALEYEAEQPATVAVPAMIAKLKEVTKKYSG